MKHRVQRHRGPGRLRSLLLAPLLLAGALAIPHQASAARAVVQNRTIGVSLTLPSGWIRLARATDAPLGMTLDRVTRPAHRGEAGMSIEVLAPMKTGSPSAAAHAFACGITRGLANLHLQRKDVRYGKAPGVMLLGMPGNQRTVQIVIAAHRVVYNLVFPGARLAQDQRQALASIRFFEPARTSPVQSMKVTVKPCAG